MAQATERTAFADRVYLGKAEPKLKEVEIKSGTRKGEKETVLEFLCSKPSFTKEGKIASWENVKVEVWGPQAKRIAQHLQTGMALEVRGASELSDYQTKEGKTVRQTTVHARAVALALDQASVKQIQFEKSKEHEQPESEVTETQNKTVKKVKAKAAAER